jgi:ADP-L-glycero-D-manno-heptose 6-epimerase
MIFVSFTLRRLRHTATVPREWEMETDLDRLKPLNLYGLSKHLLTNTRQRTAVRKIVGLKYFNVFGPNEITKAICAASKQSVRSDQRRESCSFSKVQIDYADGEFGRDFVYIKDASRRRCFSWRTNRRLFNVGSGG